MTKYEALKLALEALEKISKTEYHIETPPIESLEEKMRRIAYKAITAIKEALMSGTDGAQPEQEPRYGYKGKCNRVMSNGNSCGLNAPCPDCGLSLIDCPQPQPWEKFCDSNCVWTDHHPDCKLAEQEPVAWRNAAIRLGEDLCSVGPFGYYDMTAEQWLDWALSVVTVHAPPPQRKPLTDEEIDALWLQHDFIRAPDRKRQAFARAIEAAVWEKQK